MSQDTDDLLAELREANRQLSEERRIFVNGPVVVFKWRNEEGWPVDYASPNAKQILGYSAEEFRAGLVRYGDLISPADVERVTHEVTTASESGADSFEHQPYRIVHRDGQEVWLNDVTTILRDEQGRITHYLGYVIDITERRKMEEERQRLETEVLRDQKLESLGILAGGIAHDFNNLLTTILANANLVRDQLPASSPCRQNLDDILGATERAADLCKQMLAYSGRGQFVVRALDLNQIVEEITHILEISIPKTVTLRFEPCPDLPAIEADATQVRQVLMNLITNAVEAIGDRKGTVRLSTDVLSCRGRRMRAGDLEQELADGDYVGLIVEDDGRGMEAETASRIFDPFFTTKPAGRGLGLAAVLGIVRGHDGGIEVRSTPGSGTRFELVLPRADGEAVPVAVAGGSNEAFRGSGTVLVIDDDESVRRVAAQVLEGVGFEVVTAADGAEGLQRFDEHSDRITLVVLDLVMPNLDGEETFARLIRRSSDLPVVVISAFDRTALAARFPEGGPSGFVHKPFVPDQLVEAVRQVLASA